ncbi:MAG TPA: hypothetical protein VH594_15320 [Trebonia sp.]|jgi:hypothetical protein
MSTQPGSARSVNAQGSSLGELRTREVGDAIELGNEFAQVRVCRVETRNGSRLLIESPKSGQWIALCPLELEALTWQGPQTFSAMIGHPFGPLIEPEDGT